MQVETYVIAQTLDRQNMLSQIHNTITAHDMNVEPVVELMMGKEMIVYKQKGMMKYALASTKNYMSLHVLPMYMNQALYNKYQALLPDAKFQKGCINFMSEDELPFGMVQQLITDCSPIDLVQIREDQLKAKKAKK